jgi:uncharacterized protein YgfB (UPF0149 family)
MHDFSELNARVDALCARTRAFLDGLGELASNQRRLCESVAEIRGCLAALRSLEQAQNQIEQGRLGDVHKTLNAALRSAEF